MLAVDKDKIVLSYHDSLLHESDVGLLDDTKWLNDRLIGFVYEYMERETFVDAPTSLFLFMTPSTVQCLKLCSSMQEAEMCFLEPLDARNKRYIFIPINNNANAEQAGGSHWSLLLYDKRWCSFVHYDSIGSNYSVAKAFVNKYASYFGLSAECYRNADNYVKQTNSYDCGMFVLGRIKHCFATV